MPVLRMRIRITRPRIRMRISGLANDFQKGKNINFESNDPASRQKISPQKGVSRRFRASRTAERPEYEKQSVEMKRIGNLYEKIISLDNLRLADEKARRGKLRSYGVLLHDKNREANILALHETLKNHTFKNSEYSTFTIYEPKERIIFRLPYYPDRILHHAIMNILEPIWVSVFTKDTYSCIKGRGIHGAMRNVKRAIKDRENARYCLKIDIRKFYPSIDHDVLKTIIRRKIKCKDTLALLDTIIGGTISDMPTTWYFSPPRKRSCTSCWPTSRSISRP